MTDDPAEIVSADSARPRQAQAGEAVVIGRRPRRVPTPSGLPIVGLRVRHGHFAVGSATVGAAQIADLIGPRSSFNRARADRAVRFLSTTAARALRRRAQPGILTAAQRSPLLSAVLEAGPTFLATQARDSRIYVRCYSAEGRLSAVAKVVRRSSDRDALDREERALGELCARPALRSSVPTVLGAGRSDAYAWLLTSAQDGVPAPVRPNGTIDAWLDRLVAPERWSSLTDCPLVAETGRLAARTDGLRWKGAWRGIEPSLAAHAGPQAFVHGDFVPWNILISTAGPSVFDWETAQPQGLAGWDRSFFTLQSGIVKHGWDGPRLARETALLTDALTARWYEREAAGAVVACVLLRTGIDHEAANNSAFAQSVEDALQLLVPTLHRV